MADVYKDFQREPSKSHQCMHESEKDGARCRAMSMQNNYMCYAHRTDDVPTVIENDMFLIDNLDTHEAIQKALCDVAARLACNHIDLKRAELLITLLRAASRNLRDAATARRQALREAAAAGAPGSTASSSTLGLPPVGTATRAPRAPKRVYTDEEKDFLKWTTSSTHYAPVNRPRPESITDDDIIAAINALRRRCSLGPIETDPNWNKATLSADPVLTSLNAVADPLLSRAQARRERHEAGVPGERTCSRGWEAGVPGERTCSRGWEAPQRSGIRPASRIRCRICSTDQSSASVPSTIIDARAADGVT
jgi:hypothetical protein